MARDGAAHVRSRPVAPWCRAVDECRSRRAASIGSDDAMGWVRLGWVGLG